MLGGQSSIWGVGLGAIGLIAFATLSLAGSAPVEAKSMAIVSQLSITFRNASADDGSISKTPINEHTDSRAPAPMQPRYRELRGPADLATDVGSVRVSTSAITTDKLPRVVTMLHGSCCEPIDTCSAVNEALPSGFMLACPTGNAVCPKGGFDWVGDVDTKTAQLESSMSAALAQLDLPAHTEGEILMGFSRGAFVARDVAMANPGRYVGLVLVGASTSPDPQKLKAAGIRRVVLASGENDSATKTMKSAAFRLQASGLPARYVSLGPVWHALPPDSGKRLAAALQWVAEAETDVQQNIN